MTWSFCSFFALSALPAVVLHQIPRQVIFTGSPQKLHDMPENIQFNVQNTAGWHPNQSLETRRNGLRPRWFGDAACHRYIEEHYDEELLRFFDNASPGYYRGDICRAAILYREGGFYVDVDVQMAIPLEDIVDERTTFASVHSVKGDIFNGLIAVTRGNAIMGETLKEIRKWYRNETTHENLMGTMTLQRGLKNVMMKSCPDSNLTLMSKKLQWTCGSNSIRLFKEADLLCFVKKGSPQPSECPISRKKGDLLLRYGFFNPEDHVTYHRPIIGWPRLVSCADPQEGCGSGGHTLGVFLEKVQIAPSGSMIQQRQVAHSSGMSKRPSLMRFQLAA